MTKRGSPRDVATLVLAANGEIIGRTRLQKTACLLELTGFQLGFNFVYHRFGPYSEELSIAASDADALGMVTEKPCKANWGGKYSVFSVTDQIPADIETAPSWARKIAQRAAAADSVELELAVTAGFLSRNKVTNPWEEVTRRKWMKASEERLKKAKKLYEELREIEVPSPLPVI